MAIGNLEAGQHLYYFIIRTAGETWTYKVTEYEYVKPEAPGCAWGNHILRIVDTGRPVRRDVDPKWDGDYARELSPLYEQKWGVWSLSNDPKVAFSLVRKMYEHKISVAEEHISAWKDIIAKGELT